MTGQVVDAPGHRRAGSGETLDLAFVVCLPFHGATLLSLLLNNHTEISAIGENPSVVENRRCTCGAMLSGCEFWGEVRERTQFHRLTDPIWLLPTLPWPLQRKLLEGHGGVHHNLKRRLSARVGSAMADRLLPVFWRATPGAVADYLQTWEACYDVARERHGTRLVVDGSKSSRKPRLFAEATSSGPRPKVIHLVRDPRGFLLSVRGHGARAEARAFGRAWAAQHRRFEALESSLEVLRVRYEDLAATPETELRRIFSFLGCEWEPVIGPPRFAHKHHLIGNEMRLAFDGCIALDQRWRSELDRADARSVLTGAGELASDFGYA